MTANSRIVAKRSSHQVGKLLVAATNGWSLEITGRWKEVEVGGHSKLMQLFSSLFGRKESPSI